MTENIAARDVVVPAAKLNWQELVGCQFEEYRTQSCQTDQ